MIILTKRSLKYFLLFEYVEIDKYLNHHHKQASIFSDTIFDTYLHEYLYITYMYCNKS